MQKEKVVIIGSGPAGLTAALYTARANLNPLVLAGDLLGGQISLTSEVENYPGFPQGVTGPELVELMKAQAERFGARLVYDLATQVDFGKGGPFYLKTATNEYEADAVIVTVGASPAASATARHATASSSGARMSSSLAVATARWKRGCS